MAINTSATTVSRYLLTQPTSLNPLHPPHSLYPQPNPTTQPTSPTHFTTTNPFHRLTSHTTNLQQQNRWFTINQCIPTVIGNADGQYHR
ncbi:hypothetical protein BC938DRAFT_475296 [Jimgerdemannia flammicorona]|uniref:Uncharacterized protein n=1 Tax=Jimgerdemannia flammicorona TaxID=994334 RepID=A0A433QZH1_9FUNG|nr:hypothetical protein BC938DRAFT_475296 [Jimgerdemannia flammicorona]